MKKNLMFICLLLFSLVITACGAENTVTSENNSETATSTSSGYYLDVIQWNGNTYINKHDGSEVITGELIGTKLGEIEFKVVGSDKDAMYQLQDGDATMIEEGTMVYEVAGTENIAVKIDDQWTMYQKM